MLLISFWTLPCQAQSPSAIDLIINKDSATRLLLVLASDSFGGRLGGSVENKMAGEFIAKEFEAAGLKPLAGLNGYFEEVAGQGSNVIGVLGGDSLREEIIIMSAHYDHIGRRSSGTNPFRPKELELTNDSVYNGANDNASGVSAVMLLARYFAALNSNNRTIFFIAFTGEESGMIGSNLFASNIDPLAVKAVLNLEMLGRGKQPFVTGYEKSDLIQILNKQLYSIDPKTFRRRYFKKEEAVLERLFERSDNYPFALRGIPAHTIMSTLPSDPFYHSLHDEVRTLHLDSMTKMIKAVALASGGLIQGTDTPTRIR